MTDKGDTKCGVCGTKIVQNHQSSSGWAHDALTVCTAWPKPAAPVARAAHDRCSDCPRLWDTEGPCCDDCPPLSDKVPVAASEPPAQAAESEVLCGNCDLPRSEHGTISDHCPRRDFSYWNPVRAPSASEPEKPPIPDDLKHIHAKYSEIADWEPHKSMPASGTADLVCKLVEGIAKAQSQVAELTAERDRMRETNRGWLKANGPRGWIYGLREQLQTVLDRESASQQRHDDALEAMRIELSEPWKHSEHWRNPETGQVECECCCKWALDAAEDHRKLEAMRVSRMQKFWDAQADWSQATFGSDTERGPVGPLKHLAKEVQECLADPFDLIEKADCLFLIFDAVHRSGCTLDQLMDAAESKLEINKARKWGKPKQDGEPVEHIRAEGK